MNNQDLKTLQQLELKIAKEINRVCEIIGIRYFLIGGTFLGAVRHKGFIPWDDDIDVGMIREDYERFMKEAPEYLGDEFFLQNWDTDPNYPFSFGKLRLNGTVVVEKMNDGVEGHKGVFLDIFPYDNVPEDPKLQKKQARNIYILKKMMWIKKGYGKNLQNDGIKMWLKYNGARLCTSFVSYAWIKETYSKELTKYNGRHTEKLFISCLYSYEKSCVERKWVEELANYEFEDALFPAPRDYDSFLTALYGDYMTLPPVEKRHTHEIQSLILEDI